MHVEKTATEKAAMKKTITKRQSPHLTSTRASRENSQLICTYWSSFSSLPDASENYQKVRYELFERENATGKNATELRITQENTPTKEAAEHSEKNWGMVLAGMKKLLEK